MAPLQSGLQKFRKNHIMLNNINLKELISTMEDGSPTGYFISIFLLILGGA